MKKTLIALAAVAAATGAMAQSSVTLSGKLRFAYENLEVKTANTARAAYTTTIAAKKEQGLRVTDGDLRITATEDLGGGLKVTAVAEFVNRGRDTTIAGRDASITVAGGFGTVIIGAIESANGIEPLAAAGAPGFGDLDANNFGYNVLRGAGNVDMLRYVTPTMNGFNAYVSLLDGTTAGGMESTAKTQDITQIGFNYSAGALRLAGDYAKWNKNAAPAAPASNKIGDHTFGSAADALAAATAALPKNRTRISGNYNLGVATVGAGYEVLTLRADKKDKQMMVGVSVPLGAITVGATYAEGKVEGAKKRTGYDLGANYALSKRTYVGVHYLASKDKNATASATDSRFRVQLAHSF